MSMEFKGVYVSPNGVYCNDTKKYLQYVIGTYNDKNTNSTKQYLKFGFSQSFRDKQKEKDANSNVALYSYIKCDGVIYSQTVIDKFIKNIQLSSYVNINCYLSNAIGIEADQKDKDGKSRLNKNGFAYKEQYYNRFYYNVNAIDFMIDVKNESNAERSAIQNESPNKNITQNNNKVDAFEIDDEVPF